MSTLYADRPVFEDLSLFFEKESVSFGISAESYAVYAQSIDVERHFFVPISRFQANTTIFNKHVNRWRNVTLISSSISDIISHPSFQEIVLLGVPVIPLVLGEIKKKPDLLFLSLKMITGEDPVNPDHQGDIQEMVNDWLEWGRERGYCC